MNISGLAARWRSWAPQLRSILRIVAAFLYMQVGSAKWFAFPIAVMPGGGTVPIGSQLWFAAVLEVVGGSLILLGWCTRPVAFLLSGEMAFAYFIGHAPHGFWPIVNQGSPAIFFCFLWFYLSAAGPGPWSVDAMRGKA